MVHNAIDALVPGMPALMLVQQHLLFMCEAYVLVVNIGNTNESQDQQPWV